MSTSHGSISEQSRKRLQGGELILKGYDDEDIACILDVGESSVKRWRRILNAHDNDIACLARKKGSGRPPELSDDEKERLREIILGGDVKAGYPSERWTSRNVADVICNEFGIKMTSRNVRYILPTLGLSPQKPVVKSHKYSDEEVLRWTRNAWKRIKKKRRNSVHC
jgi:Transposase and inactivated derivatives